MAKYEPLDIEEDEDDRRDSESPLLLEEEYKGLPTARRRRTFPLAVESQRNALLALVFLLVLALAGQSAVHHTPPRPPPSRTQPPPPPAPAPSLASTPVPLEVLRRPSLVHDDLNRGRWEAPSQVWTKETVVEVWGSPAMNSGHMRTTEISALSWKPEGEMRDWDTFDFLKRMYNSQKGLLLVGDSVTLQSVEALKSLLNLASLSNGYRGKSRSWHQKATGSPPHQALFASNATLDLLRRALPNVPAERFDQPFAHILRHDILLHPEELRSIAVVEGLGEAIKFEGWLQNKTWESVLPSKEKGWEGEENSVLFFNTGAHWSLACLGLDASGLAKLGRAAARTLLSRLSVIPSLDLVYRSTTPAHPDCEKATTPLYPALPFIEFYKHPDWSWGSFGDLNHVWAEELDAAAPEGKSRSGASVAFLNVTEMAGQRPDAHMANGDCLHWALPVVPGTWIKLLWTIVMGNKM